MSIEKKPYVFRFRALLAADGSLAGAEVITKTQLVEDGKVLSEIDESVRTLNAPAALRAELAAVLAKFEQLHAAEEAARVEKKRLSDEAEEKARVAREAADAAAKAKAASG